MSKKTITRHLLQRGYQVGVRLVKITDHTIRSKKLEVVASQAGYIITADDDRMTIEEVERLQRERKRHKAHRKRLKDLQKATTTASRTKIAYKMKVGWNVTEWEEAMFKYYAELYLWK